VKPVYQVMAEAGEPFDPNAFLPAVTAYYSTADRKMLSLPFNSTTAITYWNKDAFKKAGLDPDKAPKTWPDTLATAQKLRAAGITCGLTAGWISWTQIEQFSAWHNIPLATKANGLEGADAELEFNNPVVAKHIRNLAEAQKDKSFDYGGRTSEAEGKFVNGECGMIQTSSAAFGIFKAGAKFDFGMAELPYYPDDAGAPQNSIIGGRQPVGHGREETRGIRGCGQVPHVSVANRSAARAARGDRLSADHQGSLCSGQSLGVLRQEPGSRDPGHPDDGKTAYRELARAAPSVIWCRSATSSLRISKRPSWANRMRRAHWMTRSNAAMACYGSSSETLSSNDRRSTP